MAEENSIGFENGWCRYCSRRDGHDSDCTPEKRAACDPRSSLRAQPRDPRPCPAHGGMLHRPTACPHCWPAEGERAPAPAPPSPQADADDSWQDDLSPEAEVEIARLRAELAAATRRAEEAEAKAAVFDEQATGLFNRCNELDLALLAAEERASAATQERDAARAERDLLIPYIEAEKAAEVRARAAEARDAAAVRRGRELEEALRYLVGMEDWRDLDDPEFAEQRAAGFARARAALAVAEATQDRDRLADSRDEARQRLLNASEVIAAARAVVASHYTAPQPPCGCPTCSTLRRALDLWDAAKPPPGVRNYKDERDAAVRSYDHLAGRVLFWCAVTGDGQTPEQAIESHFSKRQ